MKDSTGDLLTRQIENEISDMLTQLDDNKPFIGSIVQTMLDQYLNANKLEIAT
jgi:hypothetical protein